METWTCWVPCNLCGSSVLKPLWIAARSRRQVVRCAGCRLVFYNPQPSSEQLRRLYDHGYFDREFAPPTAGEQTALAHRRLVRIERDVNRGRLLDVGCGVGRFLAAAAARGWDAVGIDGAEAAVRAASALGVPVLHGDLSSVDAAGHRPFDVVTMWDVIEHLSDPVGDLRRARAWLRPGGLLVVQSPNGNGVPFAWLGRRWEQFVEAHLYYFSPPTLRRALREAGFERIVVEGSEAFVDATAIAAGWRWPDLRDGARRLRDRALVALGHDAFNIMVATGYRPIDHGATA
jgi:2-polyprenyl-3-methyl-5-hydroxy-6-metoxy-1,4-benzoquinol methylase